MKTLKKGDSIKRVGDTTAKEKANLEEMLSFGWEYTSKSEWKALHRKDAPKKSEEGNKKRGKNAKK